MSQTQDASILRATKAALLKEPPTGAAQTQEVLLNTTALGHSPLAIANEFILRAQALRDDPDEGSRIKLSSLQIGKMVVVAHQMYLAAFGEPLCDESVFNDPACYRFVHFPSLREALKACRDGIVEHPIRSGISVLDQIFPGRVSDVEPVRAELSFAQKAVIDHIWKIQIHRKPECDHWSEFTKLYDDKIGELDNALLAERFTKRLAA